MRFLFEAIQYSARIGFRLPHDGQVAHHLETATIMDRFDEIDGFFARASARPVCHRTETRIKPLDAFDLAKEAFLAFFSLWGKKFDR